MRRYSVLIALLASVICLAALQQLVATITASNSSSPITVEGASSVWSTELVSPNSDVSSGALAPLQQPRALIIVIGGSSVVAIQSPEIDYSVLSYGNDLSSQLLTALRALEPPPSSVIGATTSRIQRNHYVMYVFGASAVLLMSSFEAKLYEDGRDVYSSRVLVQIPLLNTSTPTTSSPSTAVTTATRQTVSAVSTTLTKTVYRTLSSIYTTTLWLTKTVTKRITSTITEHKTATITKTVNLGGTATITKTITVPTTMVVTKTVMYGRSPSSFTATVTSTVTRYVATGKGASGPSPFAIAMSVMLILLAVAIAIAIRRMRR